MLNRFKYFKIAQHTYPRQFWLLFWGMLISTTGQSMIWPFMTIYATEKLQLPLTVISSLFTINSIAGIVFALVAGPVVDRLGRKWVMVISLLVNGAVYLFLSQAGSLLEFGILQAVSGAFGPLYRVGADAMMADLVPEEHRAEGYSIMRLGNNVGVSIGPAVGGFIASSSYTIVFLIAASGLAVYGSLVAFFASETLPRLGESGQPAAPASSGYERVFRDKKFLAFTASFMFTQMAVSLIWVLLSVYAKHQYGVPESQYGWLATTNALMVVFLQLWLTRRTARYHPLTMMAFGSLLYAVSVGSVAFMQGFWGFWACMVIMTLGEMLLVPNSNTFAANLAPVDMRGRYMSIYGLTWPVAVGIGPVVGGWLSDNIGPAYTWYGGFFMGLFAVVGFLLLYGGRNRPARAVAETEEGTG